MLITLFFIIAVTAVVGVSLKQLQEANSQLQENRFLAQSAITLEDVLEMVGQAERFGGIDDTLSLNHFLKETAAIPVESGQFSGKITLKSARERININTLLYSEPLRTTLERYLGESMQVADAGYLIYLMMDCMGGQKEEGYWTDIFDRQPWMYRERIVNKTHFGQILDFYVRSRHDPSVYKVPWDRLIRFGERTGANIVDANYMAPELWAMLLVGTYPSADELQTLAHPAVPYESVADLPLPEERAETLVQEFSLGFYAPVVDVKLVLKEGETNQAVSSFEYDLKTKKAGRFDYAI